MSSPLTLPKGPHKLTAEEVAASQRSRILRAIVDEVAHRGYSATSVATVIAAAGVSRKTFYELFGSKEECFLVAFDEAQDVLAAAIVDATLSADGPDDRLAAGYGALCATLSANPTLATVFIVVAPEAGQAVMNRRERSIEESVQRLRWLYAESARTEDDLPAELPEHVARGIVGATDALITHQARTVGVEKLGDIVEHVVANARTLMYGGVVRRQGLSGGRAV